jgi:serine-type D-Ala-D-Ala endopeptidase (penicillin-binding protein 7)
MQSTRKLLQKSLLAIAAATLALGQATAHAEPVRAKKAKAAAKGTPDFTKDGQPNLLSHAVMVFDQTSGMPLYSRNADMPMPIASITKIMTAMVVLDAKLDMDEAVVIAASDIDTIKGSRSRLPVGSAFRREDLLRLALMASDNRAASALGRAYPGGLSAFIDAMNAQARLLGMSNTRFVDPTGLAPGNISSPQDLARMVAAASAYPRIREYSTTPELQVTLPNAKRTMGFSNTNQLVKSQNWDIGLSKTGYISEAGKCLVMQATIANNPVVIVLLDSWGRLTRIGDANRIKKWLEVNKLPAASKQKLG